MKNKKRDKPPRVREAAAETLGFDRILRGRYSTQECGRREKKCVFIIRGWTGNASGTRIMWSVWVSGGWSGGNSITVVKISRAFRRNGHGSRANKSVCACGVQRAKTMFSLAPSALSDLLNLSISVHLQTHMSQFTAVTQKR